MADKYVTLFDTLYGGAKWDVGVAINRSNALPLDRNSIFPSFELARAYAAMDEAAMKAELINLGINTASKENVKINNNAYAGQVLAVVTATETTIYYIDANKELQEVGGKVGVDGASIKADENGNLYIGGFDSAEALTLPQKQADGSILWVPISSIVEGDGNTKTYVAAANNSVVVEKTEETEEKISYTVAANISDKEGNVLILDEKGLYVPTPEKYNDAELRDLINEKANASALDNFYTKEQVDNAIDADVKVVGDKVATLEEQIKGLSGAMHFRGVLQALPGSTEGYEDGDVIIVGDKEYVCSGNLWVLFGDVTAEGERLTALETAVNTTIPANYALKSEIPTKVDQLENNAGYITKDVEDLVNYDTTSVVEGKIEQAITDLGMGDYIKSEAVENLLKEKQDVIEDLDEIREGAGKGATALQAEAIADMLTKTEAQGIYETIENVNLVKGRVEALEGGISSKQEQVIAGEGIVLGDDSKTISANLGDGLKIAEGKITIDDAVIASQSEFDALDGRVGEVEAALPEIRAGLESISDLVKSTSDELNIDADGQLKIVSVDQVKVAGLQKVTSAKDENGNFVDTKQDATLADILSLASYNSETKQGQAGLMSVADKEKLAALIISDNGIEVSGKVSVENVNGLPAYLNRKVDKVEFADVEVPGAMVVGSGLEQVVTYQLPLITSKDVKEINVNKLVQTEGEELILNGGNASKVSA
jgi:hypothetical protein